VCGGRWCNIGLQNHDPGDVVWFKEISVRALPETVPDSEAPSADHENTK
jgi:hypothetical protein